MSVRAGVALLEVLLSVSILSLGMGAAFESLSTSARTQSRLEERAVARLLAERQLAECSLQGALSGDGESSGRFDKPYEMYSWSLRTYAVATEAFPLGVADMKVFRNSDQGTARQVYCLRTAI